jgi:hypothetical protein
VVRQEVSMTLYTKDNDPSSSGQFQHIVATTRMRHPYHIIRDPFLPVPIILLLTSIAWLQQIPLDTLQRIAFSRECIWRFCNAIFPVHCACLLHRQVINEGLDGNHGWAPTYWLIKGRWRVVQVESELHHLGEERPGNNDIRSVPVRPYLVQIDERKVGVSRIVWC